MLGVTVLLSFRLTVFTPRLVFSAVLPAFQVCGEVDEIMGVVSEPVGQGLWNARF